MNLSIGIVGLPNVGKSTLFKLLTKKEVNIANYPFATIDPNIGVVPVPDQRLQKLAALSKSEKIVPAVVEFYDIAGLVRGASKGEGLGNQFLANIRETNIITIVLRIFKNENIIHIDGTVDAVRDLDTIESELIFKDLEAAEKRLEKATREARSGNKEAAREREALEEISTALNNLRPLNSEKLSENALKTAGDMKLLTAKRQIFLLNGKKEDTSEEIIAKLADYGGEWVIADLASADDLGELIKKAYQSLDLISFFTTGEKETRAWTIEAGAKAPRAAGVIHTDFEKAFIRAEVVSNENLLQVGGWNAAKQKGLIRLEGKEYEVKNGDVLVIRHGAR